jgi:hypothetical protein
VGSNPIARSNFPKTIKSMYGHPIRGHETLPQNFRIICSSGVPLVAHPDLTPGRLPLMNSTPAFSSTN